VTICCVCSITLVKSIVNVFMAICFFVNRDKISGNSYMCCHFERLNKHFTFILAKMMSELFL
jgi:hypothetical protein